MEYEPFCNANLSNGFLFQKIMHDPAICKHFLEVLLGLKADSIIFPGYSDPPDYAKRTTRANLLRDGKVICVAEIYLCFNPDTFLPKLIRQHEGGMVWELAQAGGIDSINDINDIYTICIVGTDPYKRGCALYLPEQRLAGTDVVVDDGVHSQVLNLAYTAPNAHPDVLALMDLMRGEARPDNALAAQVMARFDAIKRDPETSKEF